MSMYLLTNQHCKAEKQSSLKATITPIRYSDISRYAYKYQTLWNFLLQEYIYINTSVKEITKVRRVTLLSLWSSNRVLLLSNRSWSLPLSLGKWTHRPDWLASLCGNLHQWLRHPSLRNQQLKQQHLQVVSLQTLTFVPLCHHAMKDIWVDISMCTLTWF